METLEAIKKYGISVRLTNSGWLAKTITHNNSLVRWSLKDNLSSTLEEAVQKVVDSIENQ